MPTIDGKPRTVKEIIAKYRTDPESITNENIIEAKYKIKDKLCAELYSIKKRGEKAIEPEKSRLRLQYQTTNASIKAISKEIGSLLKQQK